MALVVVDWVYLFDVYAVGEVLVVGGTMVDLWVEFDWFGELVLVEYYW